MNSHKITSFILLMVPLIGLSSVNFAMERTSSSPDITVVPVYLKNSTGNSLLLTIKKNDNQKWHRVITPKELIYIAPLKDINKIDIEAYGKLTQMMPKTDYESVSSNEITRKILPKIHQYKGQTIAIGDIENDGTTPIFVQADGYLTTRASKPLISFIEENEFFPQGKITAFFKWFYEWLGMQRQPEIVVFPGLQLRGNWQHWLTHSAMKDLDLNPISQQNTMKTVETKPKTDWASVTKDRQLIALYLLGLPNPDQVSITDIDIDEAHRSLRKYWESVLSVEERAGSANKLLVANIKGILQLIDNAHDYLQVFKLQ